MSLARPPQKEKASLASLVGRFFLFLVFLGLVGVLLWSFSVTSGIDGYEVVDPAENAPGSLVTLANGQTIHFQEVGGVGSPVILLHDFDLAGGYQWLEVAEGLAAFRLIIPDQIDFGYSQRSTEQGRQHTIVGRAETVAVLMEQLDIGGAHIVGAGMGGAVAAQLAVDHPDLVDRLVLISPEIYGPRPTWTEFFYRVPVVGPALNFTTLGGGAQALSAYQSECGNGWCPTVADLEQRQAASMMRGTTAALVAMAATPRAATVPADLGQIAAPTLIIWGDVDQVTPLADGRRMDETIPDSSLEVVANGGHRLHRQDPPGIAALIADFLAS